MTSHTKNASGEGGVRVLRGAPLQGMLEVRVHSGTKDTLCTEMVQVVRTKLVHPAHSPSGAGSDFRVTSESPRKRDRLADRLHSIGRFEGRRQSKPGKWTRWGLSECQDGEPIRTEAMGGLPRIRRTERVSPSPSLDECCLN